jgi:high affinity sulfate transporter 1
MSITGLRSRIGPYNRGAFRADVIAGVTVSALVIPKALGYAGIALVPIEYGLYAAAVGAVLYALLGSSRQISTGPSSALAAVAAAAVVTSGVPTEDAPAVVAAVTIGSGVLFLALAALRMGWVSRFLSKAVITGFLFGAAIEVVVGELSKITGSAGSGDNAWRRLDDWIRHLDELDTTTLWVGLSALLLVLVLRTVAPRLPGALVLVVGGLTASVLFDLEGRGVRTVGDVPRGLPSFELPSLELIGDHYQTILVASVALLLIGFSQTAGDARMFASRRGYRVDIEQEALAQGVANLGAGAFQGMPVSTSLSASSLNDSSGARTQVASLVTGAVVVATLFVLAPLFAQLPTPVLGAIIIDAVVFGMMDVAEMRRLRRVSRFDFWIAIAAILGVLSAGVLAGVVIGVLLSLGWLVYVNARPATPELGRRPGSTAFWAIDEHPDATTYPGVFVVRFDAGLYFVTTEVLGDRLRNAVVGADPPIREVVVDFAGVNFIDSQGTGLIDRLLTTGESIGAGLRLARVKPEVRAMLAADGVEARLGASRFHANLDEAVDAAIASLPDDTF